MRRSYQILENRNQRAIAKHQATLRSNSWASIRFTTPSKEGKLASLVFILRYCRLSSRDIAILNLSRTPAFFANWCSQARENKRLGLSLFSRAVLIASRIDYDSISKHEELPRKLRHSGEIVRAVSPNVVKQTDKNS